ncbi:hypothetical protein [Paraburkholderia atlantica]|uniref:hypothetical protein n=1 Tax=Paraburkholderia atlantica TaxID=2654982 RepID=UPI001EE639AA|nr:hypothetical protein [Paraburkholderia atlantica]
MKLHRLLSFSKPQKTKTPSFREQQAACIAPAALTFEESARELHGGLKPGWKKREARRAVDQHA